MKAPRDPSFASDPEPESDWKIDLLNSLKQMTLEWFHA